MATVPTGPQDQLAPPRVLELAAQRPTRAGSGQRAQNPARAARSADNRAVADAEHESAGPPEAGDWRTSPTTGDLEFFDGRGWVPRVGAWPLIRDPDPAVDSDRAGGPDPDGDSDLLVGPAPAADETAGAEDAAGSCSDPG
jgi:hypothetical protein